MQQAEQTSTTSAGDGGVGKSDRFTAPTVAYLSEVPLQALAEPAYAAICSIENITTLLAAITSAAKGGEREIDQPLGIAWCRDQFRQIARLAWIAEQESDRSIAFIEAIDAVSHAGAQRMAA